MQTITEAEILADVELLRKALAHYARKWQLLNAKWARSLTVSGWRNHANRQAIQWKAARRFLENEDE